MVGLALSSPLPVFTEISHAQIIQRQLNVRSSSNRLGNSYTLTVSTTARSLDATLKVNGQIVDTLTTLSETIDLSSHLSTGLQTIEIVGTYSPASASTKVSLTGPGTQINQQVSGSGLLHQTLQISR